MINIQLHGSEKDIIFLITCAGGGGVSPDLQAALAPSALK